MSLPSQAIIYDNKIQVAKIFVNCGWFLNKDSITNVLKEMVFPVEWTKILLYGEYYTKKEVKKILEMDLFWRTKLTNRRIE